MGLYLYSHPETGEIKEVFQSMSELHVYSEGGVEWVREWTAPLGATDAYKIDPFSQKQFMEKTARPGKLRDLWNRASELSERRKEKNGGTDPLSTKASQNWSNPQKVSNKFFEFEP